MSTHDLDRRRFLEWAARGLVLVSAPSFVSCADATSAPPDDDPAGPPGTLTAAQRLASLQGARQAAIAARTSSGGLDLDALTRALRALPTVTAAGASVASGSAWAILRDGRRLIVANPGASTPVQVVAGEGRDGGLGAVHDAAQQGGTVLLASRQARVLDMVGAFPTATAPHVVRDVVDDGVIPTVRELLQARGYLVVGMPEQGVPGNATAQTVDGLKGLAGDGLLLWTGFGGVVEQGGAGGGTVSAIATTTEAMRSESGATLDTQYEADLDAGRLVYMCVPDLMQANVQRVVYGVTPDFARFYGWSFTSPAFGFLNVTGGSAVSGPWEGVLASRGLNAYLAWTASPALPAMLGVLEDFVHLTMASNRVDGVGGLQTRPRLRNYGNGETLEFLESAGALPGRPFYNPVAGGGQGFVNVLTPTLDYCLIDEDLERMELVGQFGTMASGSVRIGSYGAPFALPVYVDGADPALSNAETLSLGTTENEFLRVDLPRRHRGGVVQVFNDLRWSNAVPLTFWPLEVTYRFEVAQGPRVDCTLTLDFRGDVRGYRLRPNQPRFQQRPEALLSEMRGSVAQWSASGSATRTDGDTTTVVTWSGSGSMASRAPAGGSVAAQLLVKFDGPSAELTVFVGIPNIRERTVVTRQGRQISDETVDRPQMLAVPTAPDAPIRVPMSPSFDIQGAQRTATGTVDVLGERVATHTLTWGTTTGRFPPEEERGGR